ncbi:crcB protein [Prevotella sp. C561]|jgi:protein CrcB|uniref:fluoride efflux transporter CrcB n=1 Tax=Prevotella sp. C561 TaxID=563031 RepID=UPI00022385F1|nr:fluoride efflux transporter CrcB [Prevotella sp. C561]EGW48476.1 crcB protein [Prevotella sp. C561]
MIKDVLLVGVGSFVGGSLRMLISKYVQLAIAGSFPLGTMVVNVLGCFLIGIFSSLPNSNGGVSPAVRLLLTTGFCGGFTTFSTFMNENATLLKGGDGFMLSSLYIIASLAFGFIALLVGRHLVMSFQ